MRWSERLGHVATTGLGIVLAVTPAALWIAWTAPMVMIIMVVALLSAGLLAFLTDRLTQDRPAEEPRGRVTLPEQFIEEVHDLFPLTYHHSAFGRSRFRRTMSKLSEWTKTPH
jgi:hypothetical protein